MIQAMVGRGFLDFFLRIEDEEVLDLGIEEVEGCDEEHNQEDPVDYL